MNNKGFEYYTEQTAKMFPVLTALTFVFGYIGFHTYTVIYRIPVSATHISTIAGIGLLNLSCLALIFLFASKKQRPPFISAFILFSVFRNVLLGAPVLLAYTLGTWIMASENLSFFRHSTNRASFTERRKNFKIYNYLVLGATILACIYTLWMSLFVDADTFTAIMVFYSALYLVHLYKRNQLKNKLWLGLFLVLSPIFITYFFINTSEENIIGLNKTPCELIMVSDTIKTKIVFSDETYFYTYSDSTKLTIAYKKDEIKSITTSAQSSSRKGAIKHFKLI